ncbi:MAG: DUF1800 family protein [Planctomycetota bacterium]
MQRVVTGTRILHASMSASPQPARGHRRTLCGLIVATIGLLATQTAQAGAPPPLFQNFLRGDVTNDGGLNIADPIGLLEYLFAGTGFALTCADAGDANDDEVIDLGDPIYLLAYLFASSPPPPAPFGGCGADPTLNVALACNSYPPCDGDTTADLAAHLLRRLGYGPTPERLEHVLSIGAANYIFEQLYPELDPELDNLPLQSLLAGLSPASDFYHLILWQVDHARYSRNQLREALVDFWENHFNTETFKSTQFLLDLRVAGAPVYTFDTAFAEATNWEWQDNSLFRAAAVGSFSDLLLASVTSKAMTVYLDTAFNNDDAPNENYARELLELHTMGVDNGYTQIDIEQVARCFTGWTVRKKSAADAGDPFAPIVPFDDPAGVWSLHFIPNNHDFAAKTIFAGTAYQFDVPARPVGPAGMQDGFELVAHLALLPQTAEYVSTKLIQKFVDDTVPQDLLAECLTTWLTTDGDLRAVIATIVGSSHFLGADHRWSKIKTPFEYLISTLRSVEADTSGFPVIFGVGGFFQTGLIGLNQFLFLYPTPEGQPESGSAWLGSTALLNRILFANYAMQPGPDPVANLFNPMNDAGITLDDPAAVVDFWLARLFQNSYDLIDREIAITYLSQDASGVPAPLFPLTPGYRQRVRALVAFLLSSPYANKQ